MRFPSASCQLSTACMLQGNMASKTVEIKAEVLNDLASRFLINIPDEDKDDIVKLCSHVELAYWFYLDLQRPEDSSLPACSMKEFMATIFRHCPFLVRESDDNHLDSLIAQWKSHKYRRPIRGAIILNKNLTKCLLVQGYPASTSWGFPKGKLEEGETDMDSAVREAYEETGFDTRELICEENYLEAHVNGNTALMYIIPGVPDDTPFAPKTRKEIRNIQWFRIEDLPRHKKDPTPKQALGKNASSFFMIIPFMSPLKKWIANYNKAGARSMHKASSHEQLSSLRNPTSKQQRPGGGSGGVPSADTTSFPMFPREVDSYPTTANVMPYSYSTNGTGMESFIGTGVRPPQRAASTPMDQWQRQSATVPPRPSRAPLLQTPHLSYPYMMAQQESQLPLRSHTAPLLPTPIPHNYPAPLQPPTGSYQPTRAVYPTHLKHNPAFISPSFTPHYSLQVTPSHTLYHGYTDRSRFVPVSSVAHYPRTHSPFRHVYLQPCTTFLAFTFSKGPILACLK